MKRILTTVLVLALVSLAALAFAQATITAPSRTNTARASPERPVGMSGASESFATSRMRAVVTCAVMLLRLSAPERRLLRVSITVGGGFAGAQVTEGRREQNR